MSNIIINPIVQCHYDYNIALQFAAYKYRDICFYNEGEALSQLLQSDINILFNFTRTETSSLRFPVEIKSLLSVHRRCNFRIENHCGLLN